MPRAAQARSQGCSGAIEGLAMQSVKGSSGSVSAPPRSSTPLPASASRARASPASGAASSSVTHPPCAASSRAAAMPLTPAPSTQARWLTNRVVSFVLLVQFRTRPASPARDAFPTAARRGRRRSTCAACPSAPSVAFSTTVSRLILLIPHRPYGQPHTAIARPPAPGARRAKPSAAPNRPAQPARPGLRPRQRRPPPG